MHICILGNSHVACLKSAWSAIEDRPSDLTLDFFAAPSGGLRTLELYEGCLVTPDENVAEALRLTSGGRDCVRLHDYGAFLIVGLGLRVGLLAQGLSTAVVSQRCADVIASSLALRVALLVKSQTSAPIFMMHVPLVASPVPLSNHRAYAEQYGSLKSHLAEYGIHLLEQPAKTVLPPCGTHATFSQAPAALRSNPKTGRPAVMQGDGKHMNSAFGQLYLHEFFERLRADNLLL